MPYPVPPPEPPAIIYIAKPKKVALTVAAWRWRHPQQPRRNTGTKPRYRSARSHTCPSRTRSHTPRDYPSHGSASRNRRPPSGSRKRRGSGGISAPGSCQRTGNCDCSARFLVYDLPIGFGRKCHCHSESGTNHRGAEKTGEKSGRKAGKLVSGPGRQLEDNSPEPQDIPVPEPPLEPAPSGQQEFDIPTPGITPAPTTPAAPTPRPKPAAPPGVRTPPAGRTVPFPVSPGRYYRS